MVRRLYVSGQSRLRARRCRIVRRSATTDRGDVVCERVATVRCVYADDFTNRRPCGADVVDRRLDGGIATANSRIEQAI